MRIVITGAAGFIGSNLTEYFLERNHTIYAIDDFSNGSRKRIEQYKSKYDNFHFLNCNIANERDLILFKNLVEEIDIIFHLAAKISVVNTNVHSMNKTNINGTINILKLAKHYNVKLFIFSSSASVYGWSFSNKENQALYPISNYGISKLVGEKYTSLYCQLYDLNSIKLRFFNVYGKYQKGSPVICNFIDKMKNNKNIIINGDGNQTRDFVNVQDICRLYEILIEQYRNQFNTLTYNVGTGYSVSINYIFNYLKQLLNYDKHPIYKKANENEILNSVGNSKLLKRDLKFECKILIKEGLRRLIE